VHATSFACCMKVCIPPKDKGQSERSLPCFKTNIKQMIKKKVEEKMTPEHKKTGCVNQIKSSTHKPITGVKHHLCI